MLVPKKKKEKKAKVAQEVEGELVLDLAEISLQEEVEILPPENVEIGDSDLPPNFLNFLDLEEEKIESDLNPQATVFVPKQVAKPLEKTREQTFRK